MDDWYEWARSGRQTGRLLLLCQSGGLAASLGVTLVGCGEKKEPAIQDLLRRQQSRESLQLSTARSLEQRRDEVEGFLKYYNPVAAGKAIRLLLIKYPNDRTDRVAHSKLTGSLELLGQRQQADTVLERYRLLSETARNAKIIGRQTDSLDELNRMPDLLEQLQRPWEAIGWRNVALKMHGRTDTQRPDLKHRRETLRTDEKKTP